MDRPRGAEMYMWREGKRKKRWRECICECMLGRVKKKVRIRAVMRAVIDSVIAGTTGLSTALHFGNI